MQVMTNQEFDSYTMDTPQRMFNAFSKQLEILGAKGVPKMSPHGAITAAYDLGVARLLVTFRAFMVPQGPNKEPAMYQVGLRVVVNSADQAKLGAIKGEFKRAIPASFKRLGGVGTVTDMKPSGNAVEWAFNIDYGRKPLDQVQAMAAGIAFATASDVAKELQAAMREGRDPQREFTALSEMRRLSGYGYTQAQFRTSAFEAGWARPVQDVTTFEQSVMEGALEGEQRRAAAVHLLSGEASRGKR